MAWPADLAGTKRLLNELPDSLGGKKLEVSTEKASRAESTGDVAMAQYGDPASAVAHFPYLTDDTEDGSTELFGPAELLMATFGLVFACKKGSYRGTIPMLEGGYGPGMTETKSKKAQWFRCTIDTAEGDEDFRAEAMGWTTQNVAWLVVAPDRRSVDAIVNPLVNAPR